MFTEGVECADHDDWQCAVDRFTRAYALRASPVIASNLGHALVHLGRLVEANEMLGEVVRGEGATAQLREDARATQAEIAPQLGRLTVRVTGRSTGVELAMDGHELPSSLLGIASPSDPGDHTLEARRDGQLVATASVHVDPGGAAEVELAIPDPVVAPTVTTVVSDPTEAELAAARLEDPIPPARGPEVYEEWWFWTIIGVAVAGATAAILGVVLTSSGPVFPAGSLGTIDGR